MLLHLGGEMYFPRPVAHPVRVICCTRFLWKFTLVAWKVNQIRVPCLGKVHVYHQRDTITHTSSCRDCVIGNSVHAAATAAAMTTTATTNPPRWLSERVKVFTVHYLSCEKRLYWRNVSWQIQAYPFLCLRCSNAEQHEVWNSYKYRFV